MLSISDDSASARKPTWPRLTPSSGTADSSTHSAPRRMVPSPPSTTISSMPSSGLTGLVSGATASASRGSMAGRSSGGKHRDDAGRAQPLDQPVRRADRRRAAGVGEHRHPARRLLAVACGCRLGHRPSIWGPVSASLSTALRGRAPPARSSRKILLVARLAGHPARTVAGRVQPSSAAAATTPSTAARRRRSSRTTPPEPSRSRPTSNCGLTSSSRAPSARVTAVSGCEQQGEGDEGHVGDHQVDRLLVHVRQGQVAEVGLLARAGPGGRSAAARPAGRCRRRPRPPAGSRARAAPG